MKPHEAWAELRQLAEQILPDANIHTEGWWLAVWPHRPVAAAAIAERIAKVAPSVAVRAALLAKLVTC